MLNDTTLNGLSLGLKSELIACEAEIFTEYQTSENKSIKLTFEMEIYSTGGQNAAVEYCLKVPRKAYKTDKVKLNCQLNLPGM